jgi:hypothetical protein
MLAVNKHLDSDVKRAAIKLWRARVPQRDFKKQLWMSKATLMRVLAFARANPADPIAQQKKGSGHPTKLSCQLGPHEEEAGEESNTDSHSAEDEDPRAGGDQRENHPNELQEHSKDALPG